MKKTVTTVLIGAIVASLAMFQACQNMKARCVNCGKVVKVTTLRGIQFDFDKAVVRPDGAKILGEDIDLIKKDKSLDVSIEGHCDAIGSDAYNQVLSEKRAKAVYDYLAQNGIEPARMKTVGYGKKKPLVPNDTPAHRDINRRVELIIIQARPK
jgi:OOP family OmpA-OmpF porin